MRYKLNSLAVKVMPCLPTHWSLLFCLSVYLAIRAWEEVLQFLVVALQSFPKEDEWEFLEKKKN